MLFWRRRCSKREDAEEGGSGRGRVGGGCGGRKSHVTRGWAGEEMGGGIGKDGELGG